MKCIFCEIINGIEPSKTIWEDQDFIAFFPLKHINPGHILLVPKVHIDYVFDLDSSMYTKLWSVAKNLSEPLQKATQSKRIGIAVEGFSVRHVHVHLVPVNSSLELDPNRASATD